MRLASAFTVALLAVAAAGAEGQVLGLPVVNNGVPTGIAFAADVGFSNEDAGKGTTIGGSAAFGIGLLGVTGSVARFDPRDDDAITSVGVSATLRLFGGPLIPFRVLLQGGVGVLEAGPGQHRGSGDRQDHPIPDFARLCGDDPQPGVRDQAVARTPDRHLSGRRSMVAWKAGQRPTLISRSQAASTSRCSTASRSAPATTGSSGMGAAPRSSASGSASRPDSA